MTVTIESLAKFAGCDADADNTVLQACLNAAVAWYEHAGVPSTTEDDMYDFWVMNLAGWYYDNRGGDKPIPQTIVNSVHQIRPSGVVTHEIR